MKETRLKPLRIKGKTCAPIIQGGMGVGVSLADLASAVANEDGIGTISSTCIDAIVSQRQGRKFDMRAAAYWEISCAKEKSKKGRGLIGINIMVAVVRYYTDSVLGSLEADVDAIFCGAGLPLSLPTIKDPKDTALIPIISSGRALEIICKRWEKVGYRPDAVVLEGPLAGGHLGFKYQDIFKEENTLENLFPAVKEVAMRYGNFPVIVAGGIYTHEDIVEWQRKGADGVQMGTRFLATIESSATQQYKDAVISCSEKDIAVADPAFHSPGSPCGLPFRVITTSPMFQNSHLRKPLCNKGYVLRPDKNGVLFCPAKEDCINNLCICNALLASAGYEKNEYPLFTVGTNAYRVKEIISVKTLMDELKGLTE